MLDREVTPHFLNTAVKHEVLDPISDALVSALASANPLKAKGPSSFGSECDLLAVDLAGRLLAVEVKPSVSSLVWTPAQATMYARVLREWVKDDAQNDPGWHNVIRGMIDQRRKARTCAPVQCDHSQGTPGCSGHCCPARRLDGIDQRAVESPADVVGRWRRRSRTGGLSGIAVRSFGSTSHADGLA